MGARQPHLFQVRADDASVAGRNPARSCFTRVSVGALSPVVVPGSCALHNLQTVQLTRELRGKACQQEHVRLLLLAIPPSPGVQTQRSCKSL